MSKTPKVINQVTLDRQGAGNNLRAKIFDDDSLVIEELVDGKAVKSFAFPTELFHGMVELAMPAAIFSSGEEGTRFVGISPLSPKRLNELEAILQDLRDDLTLCNLERQRLLILRRRSDNPTRKKKHHKALEKARALNEKYLKIRESIVAGVYSIPTIQLET